MNLIFIYGPPAAGKLTVAAELSKFTGYVLLDNHKVIDYLTELFPRSEPRFESVRSVLGRKIRLDLFEAAAKNEVDLITTFAPISNGMHDFMRAVNDIVSEAGGTVHFIQLLPNHKVLEARVLGESRKNRKIDTVERWHEVVDDNPKIFAKYPGVDHLTIDNSDLSADYVARIIIEHCDILAD